MTPEAVGAELSANFRKHGFEVVHIPLTLANCDEIAFDPHWIAQLRATGSAYFSGGNQANIIGALCPGGVETPMLAALRGLLQDDGLIAGSSAGAAMMSCDAILGGTSVEAAVYGVVADSGQPGLALGAGLGFFPYGLVDQHFIKRGRIGRMMVALLHTGQSQGFGIDENTAMFIENHLLSVIGEYGMMLVDASAARRDAESGRIEGYYVSYLDNGDRYDLLNRRPILHDSKKPVQPSRISYHAAGNMNRGIFGAYAFREVLFRLAEADTEDYFADSGTAYDHDAETVVEVALARVAELSSVYRAFDEEACSYSYSVLQFELSLSTAQASEDARHAWLQQHDPYLLRELAVFAQTSRIIALGGNLSAQDEALLAYLKNTVKGPVGIVAAAAAAADSRKATLEYAAILGGIGLSTLDLNIINDNSLYQSQSEELQAVIAQTSSFLFLPGSQERLVDTLQYRGENSRVLKALLRAYQQGASLISIGAASSVLAPAMITCGSSYEALQYGEATDNTYRGLELEAGLGLFSHGIIDHALGERKRLGRLIVACVCERQRFGFGLLEGAGLVEQAQSGKLESIGAAGMVVVDLGAAQVRNDEDAFLVDGLKLIFIRPGESFDCETGLAARGNGLLEAGQGAVDLPVLLKELMEHYQRNERGSDAALEMTVIDSAEDGAEVTLRVSLERTRMIKKPERVEAVN